MKASDAIIQEFSDFIIDSAYPCVAARAALRAHHVPCMVADHMACPNDDQNILDFIYKFISAYSCSAERWHSAVVIFRQPQSTTLESFDRMLWARLQALMQLDSKKFGHDPRVNPDPQAPDFSFSLGGEAFFIIGMHPSSERPARRFSHPALVFNPHAQFEQLRRDHQYDKMKHVVRNRDILYSGSINPMLADFGEASEVYQYSGHQHGEQWTCPLKKTHAEPDHHRTKK